MEHKQKGLPTPHENTRGVEPPPLPPEAIVDGVNEELGEFDSLAASETTHISPQQAAREMKDQRELDAVNDELRNLEAA